MTVRGHFEPTTGTTVTLRLVSGPAEGDDEKAFVRLRWKPGKIDGYPLVSYSVPVVSQGGPIKGIGDLVWSDIEVPPAGVEIECSFKLDSGVTRAKVRSLVIDNNNNAISTDETTITGG